MNFMNNSYPQRIAKWLGVFCTVLSVLWIIPAMAQDGSRTVREEIGKPIQAALDLLKHKKYKEAQDRVRETDATSDKTAYEVFLIDQVRGQAAALAGEAAVAARAFEAAAASSVATEKEKLQFLVAATGQFYLAKDYAKSADLAGRYFTDSSGDKELRTLQIQSLYLSNNYAQAAKELQADIQADEQAGKVPSEERLRLLSNVFQKQQDSAGYAATLEELVSYHPKPDYWVAAIDGMTHRPGFPDRLALDVSRLKLATATLRTADEYVEAAQLALQAGFPAEAKKFIDAGYAAGLLGTGQDAERHKRLKDLVAKNLAADDKTLGLDSVQLATTKDGAALLNCGLNHVLRSSSDKWLGMMVVGLGKGGIKHPEDAWLRLGYAYYLAGQPRKAIHIFKKIQTAEKKSQAQEGAALLGRLWVIRLAQAS